MLCNNFPLLAADRSPRSPLFTGVVAGFASEHRIWPLLLFTVAALSLFWLRTPDGTCCIGSFGHCGDCLFDGFDVERTRLAVASSRRSNGICASGPVSPPKPRSQLANGGSDGRRNWPHLHCTGGLLHRHWTAQRARFHFMGGQLDLRRQPDSFRSTANSFC